MGGSKASAPKPSDEERALQKEQTELLRMQKDLILQQQREGRSLAEFMGKKLGVKFEFDKKTGEIIGAKDTKWAREQAGTDREIKEMQGELLKLQLEEQTRQLDPEQNKRRLKIERLLEERTLNALQGKLPVDPALERDIREQKLTLKEQLQSQFGPGWETSSPAIEAMSRFDESANVLRSQARRGELTLAEQLGAVREQTGMQQAGVSGAFAGLQLPGVFGAETQPFMRDILGGVGAAAGGIGQVAGGFQMPIGAMQMNRQMQTQASIANSQQAGFWEALGGIGGGVASTLPFPWV